MSCVTRYSPELVEEVCKAIANSIYGLKTLCRLNPHWPERSVIWDYIRDYPEFQEKYILAKKSQADYIFDEILDVAYNDKLDHKVVYDKEGNEKTVVVNEAVNRSRLKVDSLKYTAEKLAPTKYGDNTNSDTKDKANTLLERIIDKL